MFHQRVSTWIACSNAWLPCRLPCAITATWQWEDGALYYLQFVQAGTSVEAPGGNSEDGNSLWRFDFEERAPEQLLDDVSGLAISSDGKQLLLGRADGSLATAELGSDLEPEPLVLDGLRLRVDQDRNGR